MTWNLRLVLIKDEECPEDDFLEVREVFYDQMGKPMGHAKATLSGDTIEDLWLYLGWMEEALSKPVLTFKGKYD